MRRVASRSVTTVKVLGEQALTLYHHKRFYHHSILNNYHYKRTTLFPTKSKWFLSDDQGNLAFWSSNPLGTCPWRITRLFSLLLQSYSWPAKYLHKYPRCFWRSMIWRSTTMIQERTTWAELTTDNQNNSKLLRINRIMSTMSCMHDSLLNSLARQEWDDYQKVNALNPKLFLVC